MTLKEFAQQFGASNWRKAFVLAIEKHVVNGVHILNEEIAAHQAFHREPSNANKLRLANARNAKAKAKDEIIQMFDLHFDAWVGVLYVVIFLVRVLCDKP
jgi:hypothetical protein